MTDFERLKERYKTALTVMESIETVTEGLDKLKELSDTMIGTSITGYGMSIAATVAEMKDAISKLFEVILDGDKGKLAEVFDVFKKG